MANLLKIKTLAILIAGTIYSAIAHGETDNIQFGAPPWPGVTVKTEIATEILNALGYQTQINDLSPSMVVNGLANGDIDVYLAAWYPTQEPSIAPLVKDGKIDKVVANITDAVNGLAVPQYVWDAGVHKIGDLNGHADEFESTIYGIAAGSPMSEEIESKIEEDYEGLGNWTLKNSNTSAMLAQVGQKTTNREWVVFHAWRPHWMNITYDLKYLGDDNAPSAIANVQSTVWTLASPKIQQDDPNLYRFLQQFVVGSEIQSHWIYEYSHENRQPDDVAREWISHNLSMVQRWLEGVETADGKDAFDAVQSDFAS